MRSIGHELVRGSALCAVLVLSSAFTGCGPVDSASEETEATGSLGVALTIGDAVTLHTVQYEITGNGYSKTGSVNIRKSQVVRFDVGGIPAGTGYQITLTAVDANDAAISCQGSAQFNITAGQATQASVSMMCRLPRKTGTVVVNGQINVCPTIEEVTVLPAEVDVGGVIDLAALATDTDSAPAAISYAWSATGGELATNSGASSSLLCTEPGTVELTLTASDSDCDDTITTQVTCAEPVADGGTGGEPVLLWNEVESNGGTPDDWSELYNAGTASQDLSGWIFKDNDDTHVYTIPAGTSIAPGEYLILENYGFGLGGADSVRLFDPSMNLVVSYSWTAHAPTTYGRCPDVSGEFAVTTTATKGAANDCSPVVFLNEVESSGGSPGDWVELLNTGTATVDLSGWVLKDNDDTHAYTLPAGTTIAAGAFLVLDESAFGFGFGGGDTARLYDATGALVDSYQYTSHAPTTYGRCPDGTGDFLTTDAPSKGAANDCPADPNVAQMWPGSSDAMSVDTVNAFPTNLSGLTYQPATSTSPAVLWGALNAPSRIYRLLWDGTNWAPEAGAWGMGKLITYPWGGQPDTEGVTKAEWNDVGIYVATERNNEASSTSRLSVLRLDETAPGTTLVATHEWNLTSTLAPALGANLGFEAITWLPDSYLVASGFLDELLGHTYNPAEYPNHGTGLFVVGVEGTGILHVLALNHATSTASVLSTLSSGFPGVMGLEFDRENNYLWSWCDDTCGNQATVLVVDTTTGSATLGKLVVRARFDRPAGLPNSNNEGFAIQPEAECSGGLKGVFWADDANFGTHALRQGTIPCGTFL